MTGIKVIKKNAINEFAQTLETNEESLKPKSGQRHMVKTIENWVTDWRKHSETKTRAALNELTQLRLKKLAGI